MDVVSNISNAEQSVLPAQNGDRRSIYSWKELACVVAGIAAGSIFSPAFAVGVALQGLYDLVDFPLCYAVSHLTRAPWPHAFLQEHDPSWNVFNKCVVGPIIEELIFRGAVQFLIEQGVAYFLSNATVSVLGIASLPLTGVVSAVAAGVLFGLVHFLNLPRDGVRQTFRQVVFASVHGIFLGIARAHFGIIASIAMHVFHNTATIATWSLRTHLWPPAAPLRRES